MREGQSHSGNPGFSNATAGRDASLTPSLCTSLFPLWPHLFSLPPSFKSPSLKLTVSLFHHFFHFSVPSYSHLTASLVLFISFSPPRLSFSIVPLFLSRSLPFHYFPCFLYFSALLASLFFSVPLFFRT